MPWLPPCGQRVRQEWAAQPSRWGRPRGRAAASSLTHRHLEASTQLYLSQRFLAGAGAVWLPQAAAHCLPTCLRLPTASTSHLPNLATRLCLCACAPPHHPPAGEYATLLGELHTIHTHPDIRMMLQARRAGRAACRRARRLPLGSARGRRRRCQRRPLLSCWLPPLPRRTSPRPTSWWTTWGLSRACSLPTPPWLAPSARCRTGEPCCCGLGAGHPLAPAHLARPRSPPSQPQRRGGHRPLGLHARPPAPVRPQSRPVRPVCRLSRGGCWRWGAACGLMKWMCHSILAVAARATKGNAALTSPASCPVLTCRRCGWCRRGRCRPSARR